MPSRGGKFRCGKFRGAPWSHSPQCVLLVCEKFVENPELRVGNFRVNLRREISHAKLKCHKPPPPRPVCVKYHAAEPRHTLSGWFRKALSGAPPPPH